MSRNDLAFPVEYEEYNQDGDLRRKIKGGLTKREYFAGLAMQGLLSNEKSFIAACKLGEEPNNNEAEIIAISALAHADALLKELEK